jgi:hypothetical protein
MSTARARMLELSPLPSGESARAHFLAITQGSGSIIIYGELEVELMADYEVSLETEYTAELEAFEFEVELEKEFEVEVCI